MPNSPAGEEMRRLTTLRAMGLSGTPPEERFDRITRMAQRLFDVPIAMVTLVDEARLWVKSSQGLDVQEAARDTSFCTHVIVEDIPMVVPDATLDGRFADNPSVVGAPYIRFYAGCPIKAPNGVKLGAICVVDPQPRQLDAQQVELLKDLALMVESEIATIGDSITDELTGLTNRRGLHLVGAKMLAVCARRLLPAVVVYIDLDDLKPVNDDMGHRAGDRLLQEAASLLIATFRESDVVARVGGDEFVSLFAGTDDAAPAVARLEAAIDARNAVHTDHSRREISMSAGWAGFDPHHPVGLDQLVAEADAKMYEAKRGKRGA